ncbi:glutamate 5-kinase [Paludicola sp. MB14-C6]|uniref:glutamate 5-kinase n=1 Tax=Paludihabitans sp. MB14-C6 TaxID=3070656 RepID=UPI0027DBEB56|nr:glutamate 5-kinase [Paludicola sp. MB14-C6]WMJ23926.1 glutamate 5-kinase [Paludicola sp. MB14-C6]
MRSTIRKAKRIVIKVGTSTLAHKTGMLNIRRVEQLIKVISDLKNSGKEIVFVTSGAIGVGVGKLGLSKKPTDMPTKQACAAIGQGELMYIYDKYFTEYNHNVAQVLLTRDIIESEKRKENVINTFQRLLELSVIPIVNENDTVSVDEIEFGDNDTLSAIVGDLVDADLLIILSDIDGLYDADPHKNKDAKLIHEVKEINDYIIGLAGGEGSALGTGGMQTKIHAAQYCFESKIPMAILNGSNPNNLYDLLEGKPIGTVFYCDNK